MTPDQLAPWIEKYPTTPDGWEPLATLPVTQYKAPVEYLLANGSTRRQLGVSNLDFVCMPSRPVAWRWLTSGPLHSRYWMLKERDANLVCAYG